MTHGHELRGEIAGGNGGARWRGGGGRNWDNCKSRINKVYFKKLIQNGSRPKTIKPLEEIIVGKQQYFSGTTPKAQATR